MQVTWVAGVTPQDIMQPEQRSPSLKPATGRECGHACARMNVSVGPLCVSSPHYVFCSNKLGL
jgi:hypothetical protein